MRVIFNQYFDPLFVVRENEFQRMLRQGMVNSDQILIN